MTNLVGYGSERTTEFLAAHDGSLLGEPNGRDAVFEALYHAAGASADPVFIVGGRRERLEIRWANRAFADAVCAEVSDLADTPLEAVLVSSAGALPLNDLRRAEFRATLSPRVGFASPWEAVAVPSVGPAGRCWVVTLRRSGGQPERRPAPPRQRGTLPGAVRTCADRHHHVRGRPADRVHQRLPRRARGSSHRAAARHRLDAGGRPRAPRDGVLVPPGRGRREPGRDPRPTHHPQR